MVWIGLAGLLSLVFFFLNNDPETRAPRGFDCVALMPTMAEEGSLNIAKPAEEHCADASNRAEEGSLKLAKAS